MVKAKLDQSTPMSSNCTLSTFEGELFSNPTLYRSIMGALQYTTVTRPYLAFVVNKACQFMAALRDPHWQEIKLILRYL